MAKKTYAEKLELYNRRIAKFHTKFTKDELYEFGTAQRTQNHSTDTSSMANLKLK